MTEVVYSYKVNKPGKAQDKSRFTLRRGFARKSKGNPRPEKFTYRMMWKSGGLESTMLNDYAKKQWLTSEQYNAILDSTALKAKIIGIEERFSVVDHNTTPKIKTSWSYSPIYTGGNNSSSLYQSGKSKNPNGSWTNPEDVWVVTCLGYVDEGQSLDLVVSPPVNVPAGEKVTWTGSSITTDKKDFPGKKPYGSYLTSGARKDTLSIPIKMDSKVEDPEKFTLNLKYNGKKVFVKDITINDVQPSVNPEAWKLVPSSSSVDEGEEFTITLVRPDSDTTEIGTVVPFKWKGTGVSFRDLASNSHIGQFVTGSEETLAFTFKADQSTEGTEYAQFVLTGEQWATCRVTINDTSLTPVVTSDDPFIKYIHEISGPGTDAIDPTITASTGSIEAPTPAEWRSMASNPITAQVLAGGGATSIYGQSGSFVNGTIDFMVGPGTSMRVNSSDSAITLIKVTFAGTSEADSLVPGHDEVNGGWYIDGSTVYAVHKSGNTLQQLVDKASDTKSFTPGSGKIIGDTKLVVTFDSTVNRTASFDIVSPSGEVLTTIQATEISTDPEVDSFEMSATINPGDTMFNENDIYVVRTNIETQAAPSVGLKMDPDKNYMLDIVSITPAPWSDTMMGGNLPSGDDFTPAQQYITGRMMPGNFIPSAGIMTRMTFDIDDQSGGRAEWVYSETYLQSESSVSNLTTPDTNTNAAAVRYNRLRDQATPIPTWITDKEDALPTHQTDYNMHKIYFKFRDSGSIIKAIGAELFEIDDSGTKVGGKIADVTFETGTTIGTNGWTAASDVSWNVNTVSN